MQTAMVWSDRETSTRLYTMHAKHRAQRRKRGTDNSEVEI